MGITKLSCLGSTPDKIVFPKTLIKRAMNHHSCLVQAKSLNLDDGDPRLNPITLCLPWMACAANHAGRQLLCDLLQDLEKISRYISFGGIHRPISVLNHPLILLNLLLFNWYVSAPGNCSGIWCNCFHFILHDHGHFPTWKKSVKFFWHSIYWIWKQSSQQWTLLEQ